MTDKPQFVGQKVKLSDICSIVSGATPKTTVKDYWGGDIKWITPSELNDDSHVIYNTAKHLTEAGFASARLRMFPEGTVLLTTRAPIGKVAIAGEPMCCNQGFKNLVCSDAVNNEYLYRYLKNRSSELQALGRGATFKELSKKEVAAYEINLPPLKRQLEAVEKLALVDKQVVIAKTQLDKLDSLVKSRFVEMFGTPDNNIHSLPIKTMGEISEQLIAGGDKPRKISKNKDLKHPYPVFANGTIADGLQGFSEEARVNKSAVTIAARGTIGFCLVREPGFTPVVRLISLVPKPSINVVYLKYFIDLLNLAGSGSSQAQLTLPAFREQQILVPELKEQLEFSTFVAQVDKSRFGGMLHLLNSLSGIMHASFFSVADTD